LIAKGETIACPFSMFIRYVEFSGMNLDSDFYIFRPIPCLFHTLSLISELAAAVAPPDLIECRSSFNPLETNLNLETILSLAAV
jgi:hypothetical protein